MLSWSHLGSCKSPFISNKFCNPKSIQLFSLNFSKVSVRSMKLLQVGKRSKRITGSMSLKGEKNFDEQKFTKKKFGKQKPSKKTDEQKSSEEKIDEQKSADSIPDEDYTNGPLNPAFKIKRSNIRIKLTSNGVRNRSLSPINTSKEVVIERLLNENQDLLSLQKAQDMIFRLFKLNYKISNRIMDLLFRSLANRELTKETREKHIKNFLDLYKSSLVKYYTSPSRSVVAGVMAAYSKNENFNQVLRMMKWVFHYNKKRTVDMYESLITSSIANGTLYLGFFFLLNIKGKFNLSALHYRRMKARKLVPSHKIYHTIMEAYSRKRDSIQTLKWFNEMRSCNIDPTIDTYNILLSCFSRTGDITSFLNYFELLKKDGIQPNAKTFGSLLQASIRSNNVAIADTIIEEAKLNPINHNDIYFLSPLVGIHASRGEFVKMEEIYNEIVKTKETIPKATYSYMILGTNKFNNTKETLRWFEKMKTSYQHVSPKVMKVVLEAQKKIAQN